MVEVPTPLAGGRGGHGRDSSPLMKGQPVVSWGAPCQRWPIASRAGPQRPIHLFPEKDWKKGSSSMKKPRCGGDSVRSRVAAECRGSASFPTRGGGASLCLSSPTQPSPTGDPGSRWGQPVGSPPPSAHGSVLFRGGRRWRHPHVAEPNAAHVTHWGKSGSQRTPHPCPARPPAWRLASVSLRKEFIVPELVAHSYLTGGTLRGACPFP